MPIPALELCEKYRMDIYRGRFQCALVADRVAYWNRGAYVIRAPFGKSTFRGGGRKGDSWYILEMEPIESFTLDIVLFNNR